MAFKKIPSLYEIAGQISGSMRFVTEQTDLIRERVAKKRKPSKEDLLAVLSLLEVMADSNIKTADAITDYGRYLSQKHGFDVRPIIEIEE